MFEQAKLKAQWAHHMIGQIEQGLKRFTSMQPCAIRCYHNRETNELTVSYQGEPGAVPADVVLLTGTVVQTLLSSLDYTTSEIWNAAKETDTRIHFPIDVDQQQLRSSGSFKKIEKFRPELAAFIIDEIQPTKADNLPIWALKRLANTDKHRNILLVAHWNGFEVEEIKRSDGIEMRCVRFSSPSPDNKGAITIPDVEQYTDPEGIIEIRLSEPDIVNPEVFSRYEVVTTLLGFHQVVTETIDKTEQFLTN